MIELNNHKLALLSAMLNKNERGELGWIRKELINARDPINIHRKLWTSHNNNLWRFCEELVEANLVKKSSEEFINRRKEKRNRMVYSIKPEAFEKIFLKFENLSIGQAVLFSDYFEMVKLHQGNQLSRDFHKALFPSSVAGFSLLGEEIARALPSAFAAYLADPTDFKSFVKWNRKILTETGDDNASFSLIKSLAIKDLMLTYGKDNIIAQGQRRLITNLLNLCNYRMATDRELDKKTLKGGSRRKEQ